MLQASQNSNPNPFQTSGIRLHRTPTEQGLKFINCIAREALMGGAKRGAKTVTLGQLAFLLCYLFPGNRILLCRNDFTDLRDTTLYEFFQTVPLELLDLSYGNGTGHNKGEREIRTRTIKEGVSSSIIYRGLGDMTQQAIDKVKSLNVGAVLIDEASEVSKDTVKMLNAQLTHVLPDGTRPPYFLRLTSNPEPGWVKEDFIDIPTDQLRALGRAFIPALPRHNPHLPPGWEQELRNSYDPEWVEKYLDGSWDVVEGTVFDELNPILHDLDEAWIPRILQEIGVHMYAAIDHAATGFTASTVCGVGPGNDLFIFEEWYKENQLISKSCENMCRMYEAYTPPGMDWRKHFKYVLIDPSTSQRTLEEGNIKQAIADAYRNGGAGDAQDERFGIPVIPAWNALELGIQHLKQRIHPNPAHFHPILNITPAPHFYVCRKRCPNTWKDIKELRKRITPSGRLQFLGRDHGLDTVRYVSNSLIEVPDRLPTEADILRLTGVDRKVVSTHAQWAKKWDRDANVGNSKGSGGSWY